MAIPAHVPSAVASGVQYLGSFLTKETVCALTSTAEAAFYSSLKVGESSIKWIQDTTVSYVHEIQTLFNMANVCMIFYYAHTFVHEIQERYSISVIDVLAAYSAGVLPIMMVALSAATIGYYVLCQAEGAEDIEEQITEGSEQTGLFREKKSFQQQSAKVLEVAKVVLQLGVACFAKNKLLFAVGVLSSGYSLVKCFSFSWLQFSRKELTRVGDRKVSTNLIYNVFVGESDGTKCYECSDDLADTAICTDHLFCRNCAKGHLQQDIFKIPNHIKLARNWGNGDEYFTASIKEEHFPNHSQCAKISLQNTLDVRVGEKDASVTIEREETNQGLFERAYALYNTGQAGLAFLQKYPEFTETILKIQRFMVVTDILGLFFTAMYLYENVKKEWQISEDYEDLFALAATVTCVGTAILSYFVVQKINDYMKSALILKDLLKELNLAPEFLENMDVDWTVPGIQVFTQCLYLNRMVASFALSFFSKQRMLNVWSSLMQGFSLWGISDLRFVEFTQTLSNPLKEIFASGGSGGVSLGENSVKSLTARSTFLVHKACTKSAEHMKSALHTISDAVSHIFDGSVWKAYWHVEYHRGVEIARELHFNVNLQNNPIETCKCTLAPIFEGMSADVVHRTLGKAAHVFVSS